MNRNLVAALLVTAIVVAGGSLSAYYLGVFASERIEIQGGIVLSESESNLVIWSYSPEIRIDFNGFEGTVVVRNCVADAMVIGVDYYERIGGSTITFDTGSANDEVAIEPPRKEAFSFAVMGDSQGYNHVLAEILSRLDGCEFALMCGDVTPSGTPDEYLAFWETVSQSSVPVYCTAGNHDVRNSGALGYAAVLGSPQFSFDFGGVRFAVVDSSDLNMTEERATWARDVFEGAEYKVMMTHAPPYDPFDNDHTLQEDSCGRLIELVESEEVDAVFTGHIHAYNHTIIAGTDFIISGGAGATMVEGEHHFVKVAFDPASTFSFEKCEVIADDPVPSHITLTGRDGESVDMSFEDLLSLPQETGYSSFENYYGNIGGEGDYSGVAVESLLTFVGGMDEGDLLRVTAADGYSQDFGYLNVYPEESWLEMQGIMIIALSMDSIDTPDWGEGPKLLMLAPDGLYSNSDCEATSYDDQGYAVYPSAGARWVKNVMTIQVIPCP